MDAGRQDQPGEQPGKGMTGDGHPERPHQPDGEQCGQGGGEADGEGVHVSATQAGDASYQPVEKRRLLHLEPAVVTVLEVDAALRIRASYDPVGGPGSKVSPPTYLTGDRDKLPYLFELRWRELVSGDSGEREDRDSGERVVEDQSLRRMCHGEW